MHLPVMAGTALAKAVPEGYLRDDTGDNISDRNKNYCELTALFWAWKNMDTVEVLKDASSIGLCHYRRYFAMPGMGRKSILSQRFADSLMSRCSAAFPRARNYVIESNYSHYAHAHHAQDLDLTREIISEKYPEYLDAFDRRMKMTRGHRFNMFIMRRDILDRYCQWLFDILFDLETKLDISCYSERDQRVYGFVSERLLDVWLDANHVEYIELPYLMTEKENLMLKAFGVLRRKITGSLRK